MVQRSVKPSVGYITAYLWRRMFAGSYSIIRVNDISHDGIRTRTVSAIPTSHHQLWLTTFSCAIGEYRDCPATSTEHHNTPQVACAFGNIRQRGVDATEE